MGNKLISISKFFIGWPLTIVALFFLGNLIFSKFQEILPYIKTPTLPLLIPSVLVFVVFFFLRALTWHMLLNFHKFRNITFKDTCLLWGTAELKRFIPGYVWSYLGKTASFSKRGVSKEKIANMLVTEITLIIVSGFIVSLLSIPLISRFLAFNNYQIFLINILVAILFVIYFFGIRNNFPKPIKYMLPGFNPGLNFTILTISCVSVFMFGLGTYLAISSVIYLPIEMALSLVGFFALSFLLSYLAIIAPIGLGVREGFITLGLSKITKLELAGFSSIFARIILIFSEILFLLIVFIWHNTNGKLTVKLEKLAVEYWRWQNIPVYQSGRNQYNLTAFISRRFSANSTFAFLFIMGKPKNASIYSDLGSCLWCFLYLSYCKRCNKKQKPGFSFKHCLFT